MECLHDYTKEDQAALLNRLGVFFAFSTEQFNEGKKEGVRYRGMGAGMICPIGNEKELIAEISRIAREGIVQDLSGNGRDGIILRELSNHECYYTGDISDCVDRLQDYGITKDEIAVVFNREWASQSV